MSDPFSINGGSIVAVQGKGCVGIACDLRLGQQAFTVSTDFPKIFPMGEKVFLGLAGLATDVQTLYHPVLSCWGRPPDSQKRVVQVQDEHVSAKGGEGDRTEDVGASCFFDTL